MITYKFIGTLMPMHEDLSSTSIYECSKCGSAVSNRDQHARDHAGPYGKAALAKIFQEIRQELAKLRDELKKTQRNVSEAQGSADRALREARTSPRR